jgi:hypothetical protein
MKEIKLTRDQFALVDDEDYDFLMQWKWHADFKGKTCYARRTIRVGGGKVKRIYMHRSIINPPDNMEIDHIDNNGLNNQKNNLRICTHQENTFNTSGFKRKSKYKGVSRKIDHNRNKPWRACLKINGKQVQIGTFKEEKQAAIAYNEAVLKYRGRFGVLNIID